MDPTASGDGVQKPLNLVLPIRSWIGVKVVLGIAYLKTRALFAAADKVGTIHFLRMIDLHHDNQLGFFTAYDGDFRIYIQDFVRELGDVFDAVFKFVADPPRTPVAKNAAEFVDWIGAHNVPAIGFYRAYPSRTVQDIRGSAALSRPPVAKPAQSPLTLVMQVKPSVRVEAIAERLRPLIPQLHRAADVMQTVHFARFFPIGSDRIAFVADFDGDLVKCAEDLARHAGAVFDAVLASVVDAPPVPVQQNAAAFAAWAVARNLKPSLYYSSYGALSVRDIRAEGIAA